MQILEPWIRAAARPRVFFVLGAVTVVFLAVFLAVLAPAIALVAGSPPPDVLVAQLPEDFFAWLRSGGEQVRYLYGRFLIADTFFPVVYALFLGGWLYRLEPATRLWRLPVWAAVCDYIENLIHAALLWSFPAEPQWLAWFALVATLLKWVLVVLTLLAIMARSFARRSAG